jgi:hypothetical protein
MLPFHAISIQNYKLFFSKFPLGFPNIKLSGPKLLHLHKGHSATNNQSINQS